MANDTERESEHQQPKSPDMDPSRRNPGQESGQHFPNQQDPSKKKPSEANNPRPGQDEDSEDMEKRRA